MKKLYFILFYCTFFLLQTKAQNYTGTWEGTTDGGEFLQVNITQIGTTICGYSWDYELGNRNSYCKANFSGYYNPTKKNCFVSGTSFFSNSGSHALMNIKFTLVYQDNVPFLQGACQIKQTMFSDAGEPSYFALKKVSKKPTIITPGMRACMPAITEPKKKAGNKSAIRRPLSKPYNKPITKSTIPTSKKPLAKPNDKPIAKPVFIPKPVTIPKAKMPIVVKKDTLPKQITKPPFLVKPLLPRLITKIPENTNGRINKEQSRIILNEQKIKISIYDNGTVDGDTVSIYFDNKLLISKKRISEKPIELNLELDDSQTLHTLVLFAENLGSIAPNTALVIVTTASGKRYQLYSSATLNQNAALIFEYKAK